MDSTLLQRRRVCVDDLMVFDFVGKCLASCTSVVFAFVEHVFSVNVNITYTQLVSCGNIF